MFIITGYNEERSESTETRNSKKTNQLNVMKIGKLRTEIYRKSGSSSTLQFLSTSLQEEKVFFNLK